MELGQVMGPQREQHLAEAPCMADGLQLAPLGAPAQGPLDVRTGESPPGQRASPGGFPVGRIGPEPLLDSSEIL